MKGTGGLKTLSEWIAQQFDPPRSRWKRSRVAARALAAQDHHQGHPRCRRRAPRRAARRATRWCVSNHGGPSARRRALHDLGACLAVVGRRRAAAAKCCSTVALRTGQDVLKALALGAKGCLIGKGVSLCTGRARRGRRHARARHHPQASSPSVSRSRAPNDAHRKCVTRDIPAYARNERRRRETARRRSHSARPRHQNVTR